MKKNIAASRPRLIVAALKGGSGKTIVTLGLSALLREGGYDIAPFKKGPDFIDAGWLSFSTKRQCHNLDLFLMSRSQVMASFMKRSKDADISLIEGNRGLYDGLDAAGSSSTAELAKQLNAPILLIVDVSMTTRTTAALIKGCQIFDPEAQIAGVILNRVSGPRQEKLIREAIVRYCGIPVVGCLPNQKENPFPERHMGLVPFQEKAHAGKAVSWARTVVANGLDLEAVLKIARAAHAIGTSIQEPTLVEPSLNNADSVRIGFIRDRAFWFYYPENLSYLEQLGATLIEIDAMVQKDLPEMDALYIGGGFPETQAEALSDNRSFRHALRHAIENGLPVYAECGGLIYLGESLRVKNQTHPMVGALPLAFELQQKPQGHGYTVMKVDQENPFFGLGERIKGHEFHYSKPVLTDETHMKFAFTVCRGKGIFGARDGIYRKNVLGTFTHVHAAGNPAWAKALFNAAIAVKKSLFFKKI